MFNTRKYYNVCPGVLNTEKNYLSTMFMSSFLTKNVSSMLNNVTLEHHVLWYATLAGRYVYPVKLVQAKRIYILKPSYLY